MRIITLIVILFSFFNVFSQKKIKYNPDKKFSPQELKADFQFLQQAIETYHAGAFWYTSKDSLAHIFNNYEKSLTDSLTERQFRNQLYKVTEAVKCGHSGINSSEARQKYFKHKPVRIIPLSLYYIDSQIIILKNHTKDSTLKVGSIVQSIDNVATSTIIKTMFDGNASDGYNLTNRFYSFEHGVQFEYTRYFPEKDTFTLMISDSSKMIRQIKIPTMLSDSFPFVKPKVTKHLFSNKNNHFYLSEKDSTIAILDLQSEKMMGYKKFYKRSFKYLKKNKLDKLIIDLRGNGGGFLLNPSELLSYLIPEPDYVEVWREKKPILIKKAIVGTPWVRFTERYFHWLPNVEKIKNDDNLFELKIKFKPKKRYAYKGKVVVLTDGGTFSAASLIAAYLKKYKRATFIGQETGGGEAGCSAFLMPQIELPNTKLMYRLPLYRVIQNTSPQLKGRGVMPDISVAYKFDNYLKNNDLELEKAIDVLKN
jgi:hypothetical protein